METETATYHSALSKAPTREDVDAACDVIRRYYQDHPLTVRDGSAAVTCEKDAKTYLMGQLADEEREVFSCIFLDTRHRIIAFDRLFYGSVDRATVHPREVLRAALKQQRGGADTGPQSPLRECRAKRCRYGPDNAARRAVR